MKRINRFIPGFENLEARELLAGNVTAAISDQTLLVVGDSEANNVQIQALADGAVRISGLAGTTINGSTTPVDLGNIKRDMNIYLGEGNDSLNIVSLLARRTVRINAGSGSNIIAIGSATIHRDLVILGGDGNDVISINNATVRKTSTFLGQAGDDNFILANSKFGKASHVYGGAGNNALNTVGTVTRGLLNRSITQNVATTSTALAGLPGIAPTAVNDTANVAIGQMVSVTVTTNDDRANPGIALNHASIVTTAPAFGTISNVNGVITYTNTMTGSSIDSFTYTILDGLGQRSNIATVNITIT